MATLVKFLKNQGEVFAFFPQLNYNKRLYGNSMKTSYAHVGQHSACHKDYANESTLPTKSEYQPLLTELKSIGYDLKVLNK
jgi:hypothetical protein